MTEKLAELFEENATSKPVKPEPKKRRRAAA